MRIHLAVFCLISLISATPDKQLKTGWWLESHQFLQFLNILYGFPGTGHEVI